MKNLILEIQKRFEEALQSKTGWGRNEIMTLYKGITIEVLSIAVIDAQNNEITLLDEPIAIDDKHEGQLMSNTTQEKNEDVEHDDIFSNKSEEKDAPFDENL